MEIIFLGTGTGAPSAKRGSPGLVVQATETALLFDSGPGTLRQLARAGLSFNDLDGLFYTHFHPDHVTDLVSYLFATKYDPAFTRTRLVRIFGPAGLLDLHQALKQAFGRWVEPPEGRVSLAELSADLGTEASEKNSKMWINIRRTRDNRESTTEQITPTEEQDNEPL